MDPDAPQLRQQIEHTRAGMDAKLTQLQQRLDRTVLSPLRSVQAVVITGTTILQQVRWLMTELQGVPAYQSSPDGAHLAKAIPQPPESTAATPSREPLPSGGRVAVYESLQPPTSREANPSASIGSGAETHSGRPSPWKFGGVGVKELGRRVFHEIQGDDCFGRAAQLAYYFLFALFPFFLFLTTLLGYLPIPNLLDRIMEMLAPLLAGIVWIGGRTPFAH